MRRAISARLKKKKENFSPTLTLPSLHNDPSDQPSPCTICEFGADRSRIGISTKQIPSLIFTSLTTQAGHFGSTVVPPHELAEDAVSETAISAYSRPIINGRWKNMEVDLVSFLTFTKQRIKDKHERIILVCSHKGLMEGDFEEKRISTIAMRVFPSVRVHTIASGYAAYLSARTSATALMIDIGESATTLSVILDSQFQLADTTFFPITGSALTSFMATLIRPQLPEQKQGPISDTLGKHVKERLCQCCMDLEGELEVHGYDARIDIHVLRLSLDQTSYIALLPPTTLDTVMDYLEPKYKTIDPVYHMGYAKFRRSQVHLKKLEIRCQSLRGVLTKEVVKVGIERYLCPELLFRPDIGGFTGKGLHQVISDVVEQKSNGNTELRDRLLGNVIICGGGCRIPGIESRLKKELQKLQPDVRINVKIHPDGDAAAYVGASCWATTHGLENRRDQVSES